MEIRTILTPAEIAALPSQDLHGVTSIVFDVLRATSTILAALANGAGRVFPALTVDEAFALRRDRLPDALLGGERGGARIDGFDLGNSPREYTAGRVAGRDVITTTTNGTVALRACAHADAVIVAGLVNLNAVAKHLAAHSTGVGILLLVCAGTGVQFALEDGLAAGALAARLGGEEAGNLDDATRAMLTLYDRHRTSLADALRSSANGRRLAGIGLGDDVTWCARSSVLNEVGSLRNGAVESARNLLQRSETHGNRDLPTRSEME